MSMLSLALCAILAPGSVPAVGTAASSGPAVQESEIDWSIAELVANAPSTQDAKELIHLLASPAFLGSVSPGLGSAQDDRNTFSLAAAVRSGQAELWLEQNAVPMPRTALLHVEPISATLFSVTVLAAGPEQARAHLDRCWQAAQQFHRSRTEEAHERLAVKSARSERLDQECVTLSHQMAQLAARCGGLDPAQAMSQIQERLAKLQEDLWTRTTGLQGEMALHASLSQRLETLPDTIEVAGPPVPNPAAIALRKHTNEVEAEVDRVRYAIRSGASAEQTREMEQKLIELDRELSDLQVEIANTPDHVAGPDQTADNPEKLKVARRLADFEQDIAETSAKIEAMRSAREELLARVTETRRLFDEYRATADQLAQRQNELGRARLEVWHLQAEMDEQIGTLRVLSGPSVTSRL